MSMRASRNIYRDEVDFTALALQSPAFAKHLKANGQLDFSDPDAVRQLTKSLLQRDFQLEVEIPENRLCPPVPNRLNYILWLQDLLDTTGDHYRDDYDPDREVLGLDVGTGCCSIYPLLGCSLRPHWRFVATDIDDDNIQTARKTVSTNKLDSCIEILQTDPKDDLFPLSKLNVDRLDFTMCNPPFYASRDELVASADAKERPPFTACTGSETEMVTSGGEIAFIARMIEQSLHLRDKVIWYTSMLGKLSSVSILVEKLLQHKNNNYAVTEFIQGNKTRRWAIAWSWTDLRPAVTIARGTTSIPKHLLPFPSEYAFTLTAPTSNSPSTSTSSLTDLIAKINAELSSLHIQWHWRQDLTTGVGFAMQNVWSRQARRKMLNPDTRPDKAEIDAAKAELGFRVQLRTDMLDDEDDNEDDDGDGYGDGNGDRNGNRNRSGQGQGQGKKNGNGSRNAMKVVVVVRWLKGTDTVLFESFCGMLKRKVEG